MKEVPVRSSITVTQSESVVTITNHTFAKKTHIMVLEEDIIRVLMPTNEELSSKETWMIAPGMEDVPFEGRDRLDIDVFSRPDYTFEETNVGITITTKKLKLDVNLSPLTMTWHEWKGEWIEIASDRRTSSYNESGELGTGVYHYMARSKQDRYYGLGEKSGELNRYGKRYRMKNFDPMGYDPKYTDPLYKHIPFYLVKNDATYGILYDNLSTSTFDMGNEMDNYHGDYRYYHAEAGDLDYYFIAGDNIKAVVKRYVWLTGKTIMGPKWSLGYSGSTMTYTDADNAQEQLYEFIKDCKKDRIPCDSFQLSSGYTSIGSKRYVFNWNYDKFPDPKKLIQDFKDEGIKLCANIKPALLIDHPMYEEAKRDGLFINNASGTAPEEIQFWDEMGSYIDFTNPASIKWWKENVKKQLLEFGISSTWNDNNEYEVWDNRATIHGFGETRSIAEYRPIQTLLMMKASLEAQLEFTSEERPYLISRSGCPGMQRYAQTWTGDNRTGWDSLAYNIRTGVGLSLSGIYNFGHDVGGFAGDAPEPELFARWVQNGIFHPRFTIHSWNDDGSVNVPWMHDEVKQEVAALMTFRVALIPYLYDLLHQASAHDEPMVRATFLDFEEDERTFEETDEFLLGEDMLVVTATEEGMTHKTVYLPAGTNWLYYPTGDSYEGGQFVSVEVPLGKPLFFLKQQAILPLANVESTFHAKEEGKTLFIHATGSTSTYSRTIYDDDGITQNYRSGEFAFTNVDVAESDDEIVIVVKQTGNYKPVESSWTVEVANAQGRKIMVNGEAYSPGQPIRL